MASDLHKAVDNDSWWGCSRFLHASHRLEKSYLKVKKTTTEYQYIFNNNICRNEHSSTPLCILTQTII